MVKIRDERIEVEASVTVRQVKEESLTELNVDACFNTVKKLARWIAFQREGR